MSHSDNKIATDNYQFINLSFLLLNKIINNLDQILDIISFSLVCKRWFDNRDKYLCFNNETLMNSRDIKVDKHFTLNSYKELFQRSFDQNINRKHLLVLITPDDEILDYIRFLKQSKPYTVEIVQTNELNDEIIQRKCYANVNNLSLANFSRFRNNIKLPSNIKEIISIFEFNESFLPLELESLQCSINNTINISLLPRTLKVLKISGYGTRGIDVRSLPPNLEEFESCVVGLFDKTITGNDTHQMPSTLKRVSLLSDDLPSIKRLTSIHTLLINVSITGFIRIGDIPESVTDLSLTNYSMPLNICREMLPSNIKHISIIGKFSFRAQISSDYRYTFSTLQHLETLDLSRVSLSNNDKIGPLPTSLINISLPSTPNFKYDELISSCNQLPNLKFVDYGSFNNDNDQRLNNTSIKSIKLNRSTKLTDQSIPTSVEIIDFNDYRLKVEQNIWPPSISSISIDTAFIDANDNLMNIPSSIKNITITNEQFTFNIRRLDQQFILLFGNNLLNINSAILNINCLTNYLKKYNK
ncbi:hypothetical protein PPL_06923 [Heterostelium album PN500]|uniref:Uncharacterized protein n=1 Tax=Heterostelium pallidum (strain ATCC 26659 / Pp 5 / PN500) TaxID=670386 RepID=D3BDX0_HETP5|nr:hypothetical protein PPL_06923 [Heterostelium album PN500]EFA80101.1 hypothetical protein PPL_06923 [Heterostelium album PN500]|eukprot:XP_020432221.1 hypothetical protein PPL_06923 [Heterostelium album PN500]